MFRRRAKHAPAQRDGIRGLLAFYRESWRWVVPGAIIALIIGGVLGHFVIGYLLSYTASMQDRNLLALASVLVIVISCMIIWPLGVGIGIIQTKLMLWYRARRAK